MKKGIFVTATGTDVGKTYVTALLIKKLRDAGRNAGYYKAALSGAAPGSTGLLPGDACYVKEIAGLEENPEDLVSYCYERAVSPHLAARLEDNPVDFNVIRGDYEKVCSRYEYITVEGSGGVVCPIRYEKDQVILLEDIILELNLGTLVVADSGLGTINATVLTCEYLKKRKIPIRGIILNRFHPGDVMEEDNKDMIEVMTGIPIIATVEIHQTELNLELDVLESIYQL